MCQNVPICIQSLKKIRSWEKMLNSEKSPFCGKIPQIRIRKAIVRHFSAHYGEKRLCLSISGWNSPIKSREGHVSKFHFIHLVTISCVNDLLGHWIKWADGNILKIYLLVHQDDVSSCDWPELFLWSRNS